jgi:hypothetical protein
MSAAPQQQQEQKDSDDDDLESLGSLGDHFDRLELRLPVSAVRGEALPLLNLYSHLSLYPPVQALHSMASSSSSLASPTSIDQLLATGNEQIAKVEQQIKEYEGKIQLLELKETLTKREEANLDAWRKKEEQLRKKEEQLREENLELQRQQPTGKSHRPLLLLLILLFHLSHSHFNDSLYSSWWTSVDQHRLGSSPGGYQGVGCETFGPTRLHSEWFLDCRHPAVVPMFAGILCGPY